MARRFENGGIIVRRMASGWSKDHKAFRIFTNDLSGRGAFVSIVLVNRDAKPDPADLSQEEQRAWALGLFAVNLTALPPLQDAAATSQVNPASEADFFEHGLARPRRLSPCALRRRALIPLSQPRTLTDLLGPADIDTVLQPLAGTSSEPLANDQFDVWVQPLKGAVVLLLHGLKLAADQQTCRIGSGVGVDQLRAPSSSTQGRFAKPMPQPKPSSMTSCKRPAHASAPIPPPSFRRKSTRKALLKGNF